ncbi:MAG: GPR endopeptidase [Bacillaceae bacterium G1]|mgnify:CR=1 FL=1|nr:GPR endopeptidase [Bacillota bacterium]OJF16749.1 MAG: GPR endopeptidase [Bacillaceae bacterium G1]
MAELDLSPYAVQTDLALEARQLALDQDPVLEGVEVEEVKEAGVTITRIRVLNEQGAQRIGKQPGHYVTLEAPGLRTKDTALQQRLTGLLAAELEQFLNRLGIGRQDPVLVVGLGNWNVTPDALGPVVAGKILVTRHLFELMPERVEEGYRPVSAMSPGVLGITGIETSEIIYGVVEKTKPDLIIAVDALASRSLERVNTTIQIADTGIHPGSGVGNKRKPITKEALGVPVVAIGVPTVVDAVSIVSDTIDLLLAHLGRQWKSSQQANRPSSILRPEGFEWPDLARPYTEKDLPEPKVREVLMGLLGGLSPAEKRQLIHEVLTPTGHNMVVTPKEVDTFIEDIGQLIAGGLNAALHEAVRLDNWSAYTH